MYYLFCLGKFLALTLPLKVSYAIAGFIGYLQYYFCRRDVAIFAGNLKPVVNDEREVRRCIRQIFKNFAYYLVDFFRFSRMNKEFIDARVRIENEQVIRDLHEQGKSVIVYSAHLGNYELGAAIMSLRGYPMYALALPHKDTRVNSFFNTQRKLCGIDVISTDQIKACFRYLRQGSMIAIVGDRDFFGKGKDMSMFKHICRIPKGPVRFAVRSGAYIIPTFLIREDTYSYRLIFDRAIAPANGEGPKTEDELMTECVRVLEKYIQRYPDQWYMFTKFWVN